MRITAHLSYRCIRRYSVWRLKRLEARDFSHVRFTYEAYISGCMSNAVYGKWLRFNWIKWVFCGVVTYLFFWLWCLAMLYLLGTGAFLFRWMERGTPEEGGIGPGADAVGDVFEDLWGGWRAGRQRKTGKKPEHGTEAYIKKTSKKHQRIQNPWSRIQELDRHSIPP